MPCDNIKGFKPLIEITYDVSGDWDEITLKLPVEKKGRPKFDPEDIEPEIMDFLDAFKLTDSYQALKMYRALTKSFHLIRI